MKQLSNFVRKIPKPYDTDDANQEIRMLFLNRPKAKIEWVLLHIFCLFFFAIFLPNGHILLKDY